MQVLALSCVKVSQVRCCLPSPKPKTLSAEVWAALCTAVRDDAHGIVE